MSSLVINLATKLLSQWRAQSWADHGANVAALAGTAYEDDGDGLVGSIVGDIVSGVGATAGGASASETSSPGPGELRRSHSGCGKSQKKDVDEKHVVSVD